MQRFTLMADHVTLLRHAYVRWENCEAGAPAIDCKRPYGNSDVAGDIAEILGLPIPDDGLNREVREHLLTLHGETLSALQVILGAGSFEPGEYLREDYAQWRRATGERSAG